MIHKRVRRRISISGSQKGTHTKVNTIKAIPKKKRARDTTPMKIYARKRRRIRLGITPPIERNPPCWRKKKNTERRKRTAIRFASCINN